MPTKVTRAAFTMPTLNRAHLHEQAYEQFARQRGVAGHLYVYDESPRPSPFFSRWRHDVTYVHRPGSRPDGVTRIGAARNALTRMVSEPVVLHLDDDDELDPLYAQTMCERLGDADVAKLDVWNIRRGDWVWRWDTRRFGGLHYAMRGDVIEAVADVAEDMTPEEREAFADAFRLGFGWSLCYRTEIARRFPFPERGTEDIPWMRQIRDAGARIVFVSDCAHLALHTVSNNPSHAEGGSPHWPQRLLGKMKTGTLGAGATVEEQELPQGKPIKVEPGKTYRVRSLIRDSHSLQSVVTRAESWGLYVTRARDNAPPDGDEVPKGYRIVEMEGTGEKALTIPWQAPKMLRVLGEKSHVMRAWVGAGASADDELVVLRAWVGAGASADQILAQAQAALTMAMPSWNAVQQAVAASQAPGATGWVSESYAVVLQSASSFACEAASLAVQAAADYAPRCAAAASAAAGARPCPALDLSGETGQGTPWGIIWNGQANVLDRNLVPQVGAQVAQAQASVAAATSARNAACPAPRPTYRASRVGKLGAAGVSSYFSANADGSYSVNTDGIAAALDEKIPNFGDALEKGLVNGLAVEAVVDLAVGAVAYAASAGVGAAASVTAAAVTGSATAQATLTTAGAAAGGALLAVPFVLASIALALWPAQAGPGCCGSDTTKPFGTCDPGEFNDWNRQEWYLGDNPPYWTSVAGSPEEFLNATVQAVFSKTASCFSVAPPLGPVLMRAVAAWNASHVPSSTRTISRTVNNTVNLTYQGQPQPQAGQPQSPEPIAVALNALALCGGGLCGSPQIPPDVSPPSAGAVMSFTVNTGALVQPGQLKPVKMNPPNPASAGMHPAAKVAIGVGGAAALTAAGVGAFALIEQISYGEAWSRLWSKLTEESRSSGELLARSVPRLP